MADLTLRTARTQIEDALVDALQEAYGVRLPPAATAAALRALPSNGLPDRALRVLTSSGLTYRFRRFDLTTDDGAVSIKPSDIAPTNPGRWLRTTSTVTSGYLKKCELFNDDEGSLDIFERRLFGDVPAILISYEGNDHTPKSTEKGALYWSIFKFTVFASAKNARAAQTARQGSLLASEFTANPGTAAMLGDVKDLLAGALGEDLGLPDVAFVEIRNEAPLVRDTAKARFVEVLEIEVFATLTHPDKNLTALGDPLEFYMQLKLADVAESGTFDAANCVTTGLTVPLGAGLTQTLTAGSLLFNGATVSVSSAAHTFSASSATYRDVNASGTILYLITAIGATEPPVAFGYKRLGVTITDGAGVVFDRLLMSSLVNWGPVTDVEPPNLVSIAISPTSTSIPNGTSLQYTATGTFDDASTWDITQTVTWVSGDVTKATIGAAGIAIGVGVGSTTIAASKAGVSSAPSSLTIT